MNTRFVIVAGPTLLLSAVEPPRSKVKDVAPKFITPPSNFARIDDEDALVDIPVKIVAGKAIDEEGFVMA